MVKTGKMRQYIAKWHPRLQKRCSIACFVKVLVMKNESQGLSNLYRHEGRFFRVLFLVDSGPYSKDEDEHHKACGKENTDHDEGDKRKARHTGQVLQKIHKKDYVSAGRFCHKSDRFGKVYHHNAEVDYEKRDKYPEAIVDSGKDGILCIGNVQKRYRVKEGDDKIGDKEQSGNKNRNSQFAKIPGKS